MKVQGEMAIGVTGDPKYLYARLDIFGEVLLYIPQWYAGSDERVCDFLYITYTGQTFRISAQTFRCLIDVYYSGAYMMGIEGELELVNGQYRIALSKLTLVGEYDHILDVLS